MGFQKKLFESFLESEKPAPFYGQQSKHCNWNVPSKRFYDRSEQNRFSRTRWHLCHHGPMKAQRLLNPFLHILLIIKKLNILHIKAYNEYSVPAIFQAVTPISMLKSKMVFFLNSKKRKVKKTGRVSSKALPILKYIIKNLNSQPFVFSRYQAIEVNFFKSQYIKRVCKVFATSQPRFSASCCSVENKNRNSFFW